MTRTTNRIAELLGQLSNLNNLMIKTLTIIVAAFTLLSCANVDITKTGKGYFSPTNPAQVQVLRTRPERSYTEIGTIDVNGFAPRDTAKMHNAIRAKAGPLGANAVIILDEGVFHDGWSVKKYASGVAISFK